MQSSTCGGCLRVTDEKLKSVTAIQMLCARQGTMSNMPVNVAVFFGKVDRRPSGWYGRLFRTEKFPTRDQLLGRSRASPKPSKMQIRKCGPVRERR
jgi:hypothetical protein